MVKHYLLNVNPVNSNTLKFKSTFPNQILNSWFCFTYNPTPNYISKEIIWLNSTIQLNGRSLFYNKWFEKGILFIEHIFYYRSNVLYTFAQLQWLYDLSDRVS